IRSGEMVSGGKQDRAFAITTILTPEENENYVPVFCIEKGRWEDKNKAFRYAGSADADLRRVIDESAQQRKVWDEINRILSEKDIKNKTWAYLDAYNDTTKTDTAYTHFFNRKVQYSDSAYAGFIAVAGKRIIDCQVFCSSDFCMLSYESLVRSYVHSLRDDDGNPKVSATYLKKFTDRFLQSTAQQQKYLARHGRMYVYNGNLVQIVAYDD
ncbi:MAG TPA: hypothetical protein PL045_00525, partial [Chitinophagaceae bacterium]|nr:hypothetical protein [Chitinophagaceae bacterium]